LSYFTLLPVYLISSAGYIPRYSSVDDPQFNLHGNLGYDPNLDNSVFEAAPPLVGAPRAIFDEDENQREPSPEHRIQQRGWLFFFVCLVFIIWRLSSAFFLKFLFEFNLIFIIMQKVLRSTSALFFPQEFQVFSGVILICMK
jgi:hypothetical protein